MKKIILQSFLAQMIWKSIRKRRIIAKHKHVAKDIRILINEYLGSKKELYPLKAKMKFGSSKIIWQYWGQGIDDVNLPEVVKLCFSSVDKNKGEYIVIRLDDNSIRDYVDLPDFIWTKFSNGEINRTFLSDILRLILLYCYGGVWLDATIFMTGPLEQKYIDQSYFMFQRCQNNPYKSFWENSYSYYWGWYEGFKVSVLNSIIYARKGDLVIYDLYMLLILFWKKSEKATDYFIFQIIYHEYINSYQLDKKCIIVDDAYPHILQTLFNNNLQNLYTVDSALKLTTTHKMSYFNNEGLDNFRKFLRERMFVTY